MSPPRTLLRIGSAPNPPCSLTPALGCFVVLLARGRRMGWVFEERRFSGVSELQSRRDHRGRRPQHRPGAAASGDACEQGGSWSLGSGPVAGQFAPALPVVIVASRSLHRSLQAVRPCPPRRSGTMPLRWFMRSRQPNQAFKLTRLSACHRGGPGSVEYAAAHWPCTQSAVQLNAGVRQRWVGTG